MAIDIQIGGEEPQQTPLAGTPVPEEKKPQDTIKLNARKSLDGNIMIFDHEDMDIVLMPDKNKIVTFPKDMMEDKTYASQDRLFYFLNKKGVIQYESVRGGSVYGSLEANMATPIEEGVSALQVVLRTIGKFIEEEKPYFQIYNKTEEEQEERLTDPDDKDSTELGEVPHQAEKGSLRPGYVRGPYGLTNWYRY